MLSAVEVSLSGTTRSRKGEKFVPSAVEVSLSGTTARRGCDLKVKGGKSKVHLWFLKFLKKYWIGKF